MREVFVASVQTVKISARPQTTDSTNRGTADPQTPSETQKSLIKQGMESDFGKAAAGVLQNM
jgi:hypothetical protein